MRLTVRNVNTAIAWASFLLFWLAAIAAVLR
jgi:hypothetical protein